MTKLCVLVTESEPREADDAVQELRDVGHEVVRCFEPTDGDFPCAALRAGSRCPLRDGTIDVALAVRRSQRMHPSRREDGALCAVRRHLPLVVAGSAARDPFAPWESENLDRTFDVVKACERVANAPVRAHTELASRALQQVLDNCGDQKLAFLISVRRVEGRLVVQARSLNHITRDLRNMIAVRIVAALRSFDQDAAGIDVEFSEPPR
jgi:hypothetical protein